MFIEQIIKFDMRGPKPRGRTCTANTGYFYDKPKISKGKSSIRLLFTAKVLHEAMYLAFPYQGEITYKT